MSKLTLGSSLIGRRQNQKCSGRSKLTREYMCACAMTSFEFQLSTLLIFTFLCLVLSSPVGVDAFTESILGIVFRIVKVTHNTL